MAQNSSPGTGKVRMFHIAVVALRMSALEYMSVLVVVVTCFVESEEVLPLPLGYSYLRPVEPVATN